MFFLMEKLPIWKANPLFQLMLVLLSVLLIPIEKIGNRAHCNQVYIASDVELFKMNSEYLC